jgi:Pvc16 N-terminal domain
MATLDLSLATQALITLVFESIRSSTAWPFADPDVTGLPPDAVAGDSAVGLYLYHLTEEPTLKNQAWSGRPDAPLRFSPMALNLHYVATAKSGLAEGLAPLREQLLLGLTARALRNHGTIDDLTVVNGVQVLPSGLRNAGNRLRVTLRPVPPNEAVSYWTAGSQPLRLAVYFDVSALLVEPDEPETGGGRVLTYGIQTFLGSAPRLDTSRSTVTFRVPGESVDRTAEVQPARVTYGQLASVLGNSLAGDAVTLVVRHGAWTDAEDADASWGVVASSDRVYFAPSHDVASRTAQPGTWTAAVRVTRNVAQPDGTTRPVAQLSNEVPWQLAPEVRTISAVAADGTFTVDGGPFSHNPLVTRMPQNVVRAYTGTTELALVTTTPLAPGQMRVVDDSRVELRLPDGFPRGAPMLLRLLVNGAESLPQWVRP